MLTLGGTLDKTFSLGGLPKKERPLLVLSGG